MDLNKIIFQASHVRIFCHSQKQRLELWLTEAEPGRNEMLARGSRHAMAQDEFIPDPTVQRAKQTAVV